MATTLRKLLIARLAEAEKEQRLARSQLKYRRTEIRELKSLLSKDDRVLKQLPKGQFTKDRKEGQNQVANGETASRAEIRSICAHTLYGISRVAIALHSVIQKTFINGLDEKVDLQLG